MYKCREYKYEGDILYLKCAICGKRKTKDNFHNCKSMRFGVKSKCKECNKLSSREYRKSHRDVVRRYNYLYRVNNKDYFASYDNKTIKEHSDKLGFSWKAFHDKAKTYVIKHNLRPKVCVICGEEGEIDMHHPSYDEFNKWCEVVFCCRRCHRNIHAGNIKCPTPINLLELV